MKLTPFFKELIEKRWSEFAVAEQDQSYTSSQAVVFSLIRACSKGKLPAIKEALDRIDGKIAMEIEVEYPKFYYRFPYAESVATLPAGAASTTAIGNPNDETAEQVEEEPPVTHSLRDTLKRMAEEPRSLVELILNAAAEIDTTVSYKGQLPDSDPLVKSVIVAGLLSMAHNGKLGAIFEVLDQIDGKVADKIKVLGGDVYVNRMDLVAPYGAIKNEDGVYQLEAVNTTTTWTAALERKQGNDRRFGR